jgi:toxin ParE1/3/4
MPYRVERGRQALRDLDAIYDFLFGSYVQFGERPDIAVERAEGRLKGIRAEMRALGRIPHQGTRRDMLMPGLRSVTKDRAVFYFTVDDEARVVRVLAVFFGGQDHQREMLKRLRG